MNYLATNEERAERWVTTINSINGIHPNDSYQIVPTKIYEDKKHKLSEHFGVITGLERQLRRRGLVGLDVKKINGYKWKTGDGSSHSLRRIKKGKVRIIFSYIEDEPLLNTKIPIFYLHTIFKRSGSQDYEKNLKKFDKNVNKNIILTTYNDNSSIRPTKVRYEAWKNKEMAPYATFDQNQYDELRELMDNSEMAILPTIDQINAISRRTRPLFINGQAGTGKTTGISWILSLLIPENIRQKVDQKNRIMVTSMTEPVVKKLQNNTNKLLDVKSSTISETFGIIHEDIMSYLMDARESKGKWLDLTYNKKDNQVGEGIVSSPNLVFISFRKILQDILVKSLRLVQNDLAMLDSMVERKNYGNCDINFNPAQPTSVKNRNSTCEYCRDNPEFHISYEHATKEEKNQQRLIRKMLRKVKNCISMVEEDQIIRFNRFRYDFFRPRKSKYSGLNSEFAWYGIRTLIKGYAIRNDYSPLGQQEFISYIQKGIIKDFSENLVSNLFQCYRDYCAWMEQENVQDYMDVAIHAAYVTNKYSNKVIENRFEDIFLDEAQDLTPVEYNILLSCLNENSDKIVLAGDPLQTINPTGFDWDRIKAMMYEKFNESQDDPEVLSHNWRTPKDIVNVSNGILGLRRKVIPGEKVNFQISNEVGSRPKLIYISDETRVDLIKQLTTEKSNFKLLTRQSDEDGIKQLLLSDKYLDYEELKDKNNMYSVTDIKGDEAENIILYRCGELESDSANVLLAQEINPGSLEQAEILKIKYLINQLYILTTRSTSRLFVIESDKHKGRIWEEMFPSVFEIDEDSNEGIDDILNVVSQDFDLGIYVKGQLKSYEDTFEPKFLRRALDSIEDYERKGQLPKAVVQEKNRILAIQFEINGEYEKSGDAWLKLFAREKAFNAFVKSSSWEKAISTQFHIVKENEEIFSMLSSPDNFDLQNLDNLLKKLNLIYDKNNFSKWFRDTEQKIIQILINITGDLMLRKSDPEKFVSLIEVLIKSKINPEYEKLLSSMTKLLGDKKYSELKKYFKLFSQIPQLRTKVLEFEFQVLESDFKDNPNKETNLKLLDFIIKNVNHIPPQTKLNTKKLLRQLLLFIYVNVVSKDSVLDQITDVKVKQEVGSDYRASLEEVVLQSIQEEENTFFKSLLVILGFEIKGFEDLPLSETLQGLIRNKSKPTYLRGLTLTDGFWNIVRNASFNTVANRRIEIFIGKDTDFIHYGKGTNSSKNLLSVNVIDESWNTNFLKSLSRNRIDYLDEDVFNYWHDRFIENKINDGIKNAELKLLIDAFKPKGNLQCFVNLETKNMYLMELLQNELSYQTLIETDGKNHTEEKLNALYEYFSSVEDRVRHIQVHLPDKVDQLIDGIDSFDLDNLVNNITLLMKDSFLEIDQMEKLCRKLGDTQIVWRLKEKLDERTVRKLVEMFSNFESDHPFANFLILSHGSDKSELKAFLNHYSKAEVDDFNSRAASAIKNHLRNIITIVENEIPTNRAFQNLKDRWEDLFNDHETSKCINEISTTISCIEQFNSGVSIQSMEYNFATDNRFSMLLKQFIHSYRR